MSLQTWLALSACALAVVAFALAYTRSGADAGQIVPAAISAVALVVSGLTLYYGNLARFNPVIVTGAVVYHPNRETLAAATSRTHLPPKARLPGRNLQILVSFVFTHRGGAPGVIEDIMLRLDRVDGTRSWLFQPAAFLNDRAYFSQGPGKPDADAVESTFHPIALAKGAQTERLVAFVELPDFPKFPGGEISPGEYNLTILVKTSETAGYLVADERRDNFAEAFLDDLRAGSRSAITPPSLTALREAIDR